MCKYEAFEGYLKQNRTHTKCTQENRNTLQLVNVLSFYIMKPPLMQPQSRRQHFCEAAGLFWLRPVRGLQCQGARENAELGVSL